MEKYVPFESAAGVAVQIDHAGQLRTGTDVGLVVAAFQFEALLVYQLEVIAFNFHAMTFELLLS